MSLTTVVTLNKTCSK